LHRLALDASHRAQLRSFGVGWKDGEAGAPVLEPPRFEPAPSAQGRGELLAAFEILLAFGKLPPRAYVCGGKRVAITKAHAKLFPALAVGWEDGDGPSVDPKRPYGYRSYFEYDMAEVLGITLATRQGEEDPSLTRTQLKELRTLHESMRDAVHALLLHGTLATGT